MAKYAPALISFIVPFSLYLVITLDADSFIYSFIFMNIILSIVCIYNIISLYRRQLRYYLVLAIVLLGLIPALIINHVTDVNSGVISFGDYFYFGVIFVLMIIPIFIISGIVCLYLLIKSKLRTE